MSTKGGYVMVDATGLDISDESEQTVDGLYDQLSAAIESGKPILVCNVMNGETPVSPAYITATMGAGATITISSFTAVVTDDDSVAPIPVGG